jgi:ribosomal protein L18E
MTEETSNENKNQNQHQKGSVFKQVNDELKKARREAAKVEMKKLASDYQKGKAVLDGIYDQMVEVAKSVGDDPEELKKLLSE